MKRVIAARVWITGVTIALFVATTLVIFGVFRFNWRYGLSTNDKAVIANTVIAACALVLVGWGVIVALAAYIDATGSPNLIPKIRFGSSDTNKPVFVALGQSSRSEGLKHIEQFNARDGRVEISNESKYSARNPGIRIKFHGFGLPDFASGEWRVLSNTHVGAREIQWDGGASYIIHGKWSMTLPSLDFGSFAAYGEEPELEVSIAADGFGPRTWHLPIEIVTKEAWQAARSRPAGAAIEGGRLPGPPPSSP